MNVATKDSSYSAAVRLARPLALLLALTLALNACSGTNGGSEGAEESAESDAELVERARGIHERVITLDTHVDISPNNFTAETNYTMDLPTQVDLPSMEEGGLDVAWLIVYVGQGELTEEGFADANAQAIAKFDAIHRLTTEIAPERIELALTSDDVRRIDAAGKSVAMIGIENAYQVGMDLDNIRDFEERGGRYMSLAHNGHSQFADSNTGEPFEEWLHNGLSDLGRQAIAEMNKWGIMVDISHPSKDANLQTLALTRAPVIASHSSARALNDHSRNLDDEQLLALKENGGVVQTVAFRSYLNRAKHEAWQEASQAVLREVAESMGFEMASSFAEVRAMSVPDRVAYMEGLGEVREAAASRIEAEVDPVTPPVDVGDLVDHIDYMVDLIGLEHVGISSDFDGGGGVTGWDNASETFNVTLELVRRGYTEEQIGMLWSGNLLRVLDDVQRIAAEIQAEGQ